MTTEGRRESVVLFGIAAAHGVATAPALVIAASGLHFVLRHIARDDIGSELERFEHAVQLVQAEMSRLAREAGGQGVGEAILEAYRLMAGDPTLAEQVRAKIEGELCCAEWALSDAIQAIGGRFDALQDPYLSERKHDVEFVGRRLLDALGAAAAGTGQLKFDEPCVVVAHDLSPADTAAMRGKSVLAFVTEVGSRTSHTAIMARALEIPAVVGVEGLLPAVASGDLVIVDGLRGMVALRPSLEQQAEAERRARRYNAMEAKLHESSDMLGATADGVRVQLHANIELAHEAALARVHGAEGVGLYRTEFLYVDRKKPPTEAYQFEQFKTVIEGMQGRPTVLRTFDIGGDKFTSTFDLPVELNPMLGLRAVRLQLTEPEVLLAHLRAMVRASVLGDVRIMVPLVCSLDELRAVRAMLNKAVEQVAAAGGTVPPKIPLGVMIEVPAAAVMADVFAREADFMSIGTNDLVQYALAIDRSNRLLAHLASPYHPAVLRLIKGVIEAGQAHGCPVSLCGEMGSEPLGALLAVGLGVRNLSMESVALPDIKEALARIDASELMQLANDAMAKSTAGEVLSLMTEQLEERLRDLLTGQPLVVGDSFQGLNTFE